MANTKRNKAVKWSQQHENRLIKNVEKNVLCLSKAFDITAKEVQRSKSAVAAHWYQKTSMNCGRTLFMTVSGSHVAINRKNAKGQPLRLLIYKKLLSILGLNY